MARIVEIMLVFAAIFLLAMPATATPLLSTSLNATTAPQRGSKLFLISMCPPTLTSVAIDLVCGLYSTADKRNAVQLLYDLRKRGGTCVTPTKKCTRHACWNTSGVYICNDNDHDVSLDCEIVANFAASVANNCCTATKSGVSGQQWSDQNWNAIISYANCNHDASGDRPSPGPSTDPWGPNGSCTN